MIVEIFTDGSHIKKPGISGRLGCGGVILIDGKLKDEYSMELTPEYLKKVIQTADVSNPTAEMMGVLLALRKFDIPKTASQVIIYTDYDGVGHFMRREWKIGKPYIRILYGKIWNELYRKGLEKVVKFEWVKGHQPKSIMDPKAKWNSYVDKLAKGEK